MLDGRPSLTARLVALARALCSQVDAAAVDPEDPLARGLLSGPERAAIDLLSATERMSSLVSRTVFGVSLGLIDHVALRTAAIDAALRKHLAAGPGQVVVLGAGLDLRVYRLGCLHDSDVFEVDHPATQADKLRRTAGLSHRALSLTHVAVDFTRDELGEQLARAGHDAARRTFWIWEGVVPYLEASAIDATLKTVALRSAPDSAVVISYMDRDAHWQTLGQLTARPLLRVLGEPLGAPITPAELAERLRGAGLAPLWDTDTRDWYRTHGEVGGPRVIVPYERLVLARKT